MIGLAVLTNREKASLKSDTCDSVRVSYWRSETSTYRVGSEVPRWGHTISLDYSFVGFDNSDFAAAVLAVVEEQQALGEEYALVG